MRVGIVDYGAGNYLSVVRAVEAIGIKPLRVATNKVGECNDLTHLVFPGVGRASQAMAALHKTGLDKLIVRHAAANKPLLGICVGMQVLGRFSSEDNTAGLGLVDFELRHFRELGVAASCPVPHMGWNDLENCPDSVPGSSVTQGSLAAETSTSSAQEFRLSWNRNFAGNPVYFVHSYAAPVASTEPSSILATTEYGGVRFVAAVAKGSIFGAQFHLEKSGQVGLGILRKFTELEAPC